MCSPFPADVHDTARARPAYRDEGSLHYLPNQRSGAVVSQGT